MFVSFRLLKVFSIYVFLLSLGLQICVDCPNVRALGTVTPSLVHFLVLVRIQSTEEVKCDTMGRQ